MTKEKSNGFDFIRDATRIVEQNEAMKSFFKDRLAELDADGKRILQIIAKYQPISSSDLRNHTRMKKDKRLHIEAFLWYKGIITFKNAKLTVHPAFMEVIHE